jgi:ABC-type branched-subunit amino acid transport system ATPase component
MDVALRGYLLQVGKIALEGETKTIRTNEIIKKAHLGG